MPEPLPTTITRANALLSEVRQALHDENDPDRTRSGEDIDAALNGAARDFAEAVPVLLEALRWRTVATDGLPEVGVRVLVRREDEQEMHRCVVAKYAGEFWGWSIPGVGLGVSEQDCWLPVPGETP